MESYFLFALLLEKGVKLSVQRITLTRGYPSGFSHCPIDKCVSAFPLEALFLSLFLQGLLHFFWHSYPMFRGFIPLPMPLLIAPAFFPIIPPPPPSPSSALRPASIQRE